MDHQTLFRDMSELIALNSISAVIPEFDHGNREVIEHLAGWFSSLGFQCEVCPIEGSEVNGVAQKCNLIATLGAGERGLVLSGHTDTVPCNPERWQSDPFCLTERDNRWYGLGTCDMKGFFALVKAAIEGMDVSKLKQPIIILATADEESSMSGARALTDSSLNGRYAVVGEPTSLKPIRMHKGIMMESIRLLGRAGHSSNPELGNNALDAMQEVMGGLIELRAKLATQYQNAHFSVVTPTLNLGCIHGGDNPNRICGSCELAYDLRALPGMSNDDLRTEIHRHVAPIAERHQVELTMESLFPGVPSYSESPDSELVQLVERLTQTPSAAVNYATEAPFLQALGLQTVVLGPGNIDQAHQVDEFLETSQIQPTIDLLQSLIRQLCLT